MNKVSFIIKEMLMPTVKGKGLRKSSWIVKRGGEWFTISVERGDKLNGESFLCKTDKRRG